MQAHNILIAAIQETKLNAKSKIDKINNFSLLRADRSANKGGGVAFLIHDSVPFKLIPPPDDIKKDPHIEEITIAITGSRKSDLHLRNIYIPPASSCNTQGWKPNFQLLSNNLPEPFIIMGDINAHHSSIYSADQDDARGKSVLEWVEDSNLGIVNEDVPTRTTANSTTAPDITVASPSILPTCSWETETSLNSDHLPIHITICTESKLVKAPKRTFINFKKADWQNFSEYIEDNISSAPNTDDTHKREKFLRDLINTSAKIYIPSGRIPKVTHEIPQEAADRIEERDEIRHADPKDPRIPALNIDIKNIINNHKREKWLAHLESCEPNTKKLWDTIKSLNAPPKPPENQSISFNNIVYDNTQKIADKLNQQYTPGATSLQGKKPTQEFRALLRNIQAKPSDPPSVIFNASQVTLAIKNTKNSKAIGPDGISPLMLKHLGPQTLNYLTDLFNDVLTSGVTPPLWKTGRIIPLLKPGKPSNEGKSYRPVSLLSPLAKLLEALLLPHLQAAVQLQDSQHGFRKGRSCATALQEITTHIKQGLNINKPVNRTVMVAVDLTCAFDTVSHEILIQDISKLQLDPFIKRFLCGYLRGRKTFVQFRNTKSRCRQMRQGVPQGGVLSPTLFNLYVSSLPEPPPGINVTSYADDTSVYCSGPKILPLCKALNGYLKTLHRYLSDRNLGISPGKSSATVFSTCTQDMSVKLPIEIDGKQVPTVNNPKILGVILDPLLNFGAHTKYVCDKVSQRNNILRVLSGSTWGKDVETINSTYKAIGRSCIDYCAPIWSPTLSATNWNSLQIVQNAALRAATGCVKKTNIEHFHSETKNLLVKEHSYMLSKQFYLATKKVGHPNFSIPYKKPERLMKTDLGHLFEDEILHLFTDDGNDATRHKMGINSIHSSEVSKAIENLPPNKVLGRAAPEVHKDEKLLPRATRVALTQLRSGYSSKLNSYLHGCWPTQYDEHCPKCLQTPHDTNHLFSCPSDPTDLRTIALWENPVAAAAFLGLRTSHDDPEDDDDGRQGDPG